MIGESTAWKGAKGRGMKLSRSVSRVDLACRFTNLLGFEAKAREMDSTTISSK